MVSPRSNVKPIPEPLSVPFNSAPEVFMAVYKQYISSYCYTGIAPGISGRLERNFNIHCILPVDSGSYMIS